MTIFLQTSTALSLLKAGAKVVPASSASPAYTAASTPEQPMSKMKDSLRPEMLLMTAVNHLDYHGRVALLQQLLGQGGDIWLEEQWPATGQTALNMAVGLGLVEVRLFLRPVPVSRTMVSFRCIARLLFWPYQGSCNGTVLVWKSDTVSHSECLGIVLCNCNHTVITSCDSCKHALVAAVHAVCGPPCCCWSRR